MTATAAVSLRHTGSLATLDADARAALFDRSTSSDDAIREETRRIVRAVRTGGDTALRGLAARFDDVELEALEVPRTRIAAALERLDPAERRVMERAAANIVRVQTAFMPAATECQPEPGIVIGRRPDPLARVGVYVPGGRAAYPSSVLMGALPARVAGVGEVIVCSPPQRDGEPASIVLAAAALANVDRVFAVGGAGAIAAMAYGTETIPRVDRIVGPGNAYVAEAKLQVAGDVGIDSPAGPSELLVIADDNCDPHAVALEMLAQSEHDPRAAVVAVAIGATTANAIIEAIARAICVPIGGAQPRRDVVSQSLATNGGVLTAADLDDAIDFAITYAPEHLLLMTIDNDAVLARVRNAGTVFVGPTASVAFGDYMTGANHVLPTGGLARSYSGLSVLDFIRWTTYQRVTPAAARSLAPDVALFAMLERLPGHAIAARAAGERV